MSESTVPTGTDRVVAADVDGYRRAVRTPMSTPATVGDLASPLYPFVLSHELFERTVAALGAGGAAEGTPVSPVHLSQDVLVSRLVRPGEKVTVSLDVRGARAEARGVRLALRAVVTGEADDLVAELATAVLLAGASRPEAFGEMPAQPAVATPPGPVDETTVEHRLTVATIADYARASGDLNPIHLEPAAAQAAGFPGVIAHGMSVLALVSEEVVERYADGDPARVRGLGCRFSSPVLPDEPLRITLRHGGGAVRFSCATPRGVALKSGWVRLATPDGVTDAA
ncbi:MaoC/PaaZ C-terminal domain-containing protein [Micromonospora sp. NPDC051925]|uniref:MaoC/PaaZ C-terminal domain-containing protein n=1 Tax=Micromonospora sp. NPDC051925 TaxID=3364288 RepID=UPI0037C7C854